MPSPSHPKSLRYFRAPNPKPSREILAARKRLVKLAVLELGGLGFRVNSDYDARLAIASVVLILVATMAVLVMRLKC